MAPRKADNIHSLLQMGLNSFNNELFFQAHEEWETLWKELGGTASGDRRFVQGLIFGAAHFIHLGKNNLDSARRAAQSAKEKLIAPAREEAFSGVDILPLLSALEFNLNIIRLIDLDREKTMLEIIKNKLSKEGSGSREDIEKYREKFELKNLDPFLIPKLV